MAAVALAAAGCGGASGPSLPTASPTVLPGGGGVHPVGSILRGPYLQHADGGVAVVWYTQEPAQGSVLFRADDAGAFERVSSEGLATRHEAVIAPLQPGARYTYQVHSGLGPLSAPGGAAEFAFRAPQDDVARFVVFGDSGEASPAQAAVARAIGAEAVAPDFVVVVGDVYQPSASASDPPTPGIATYDPRFFEPYRDLLPSIPFYAALGNHDYEVEKGRALLELLTLPRNGPPGRPPESSYWLERAGALLLVHDTNQTLASLREEALPWHQEVARRPATFRLAFQHHPVYGSGPNAQIYPSGALRSVLAPVYAATGVDVVFNGHDHLYERTKPIDGVVYVTTGGGGAALYPPAVESAFTAALVDDRHGYSYVEVRGRTLSLRQMDEHGQQVDAVQIAKPVAGADALRAFGGAGQPPRGWDGAAFDDSSWPEAEASRFASVVRARRGFDLGPGERASEAWLRVRGAADWTVRLNGVTVARGDGSDGPATAVKPSLLRRGGNVLALEATVDGTAAAAPSLELALVTSPR